MPVGEEELNIWDILVHQNNITLHCILHHLRAVMGTVTIHEDKPWLTTYILFCRLTHTFDNHSHRAGVPRLELAPIMGSLPHSLWPHDVVVWVCSSAQGSVRRRIPPGEYDEARGSRPQDVGVSSLNFIPSTLPKAHNDGG